MGSDPMTKQSVGTSLSKRFGPRYIDKRLQMESPQSRKRSACRALHTCHPQSLSKVDNPIDGFPTVSIRPVANKTAGLDERARENERLFQV
jgi:hypothetical protein